MKNALKENPLLQFTIVSFVIALAISVGTFVTISRGAEETLGLLSAHGDAMRMGHGIDPAAAHSMPNIRESARRFQWLTLITVAGGLVGLYASVVLVVWNGWRTISRQRSDMKRANEGLFDAQDKLSTILASVGNGIYGVDLEDRITFVNAHALLKLGWQAEELLGKTSHSTLHAKAEGDLPHTAESCPVVETTRTGVAMKVASETVIRKDGTALDVEYSVTPTIRGDEIIGGVVAFQDITVQLRSEMALRESEERYRDLFENSNDLIQSVAMDGSLSFVNRSWRETLGYTQEEVGNLSIRDVIHPDNYEEAWQIIQNTLSGNYVGNAEIAFITNNGEKILTEGRVSCKFESGEPIATRDILRNVTERRTADELTKQSQTVAAKLAKALEVRAERLRTLTRVNQIISASLNIDELLSEIARAATLLIDAPVASFWIFDEGTRALNMKAFSEDDLSNDYPYDSIAVGSGAIGWVAENRSSLNVPNVFKDGRMVGLDWWKRHGLRSFLGVPVELKDNLLAVLAFNGRGVFELDEDDQDMLDIFVGQAAVSIHNAQLFENLETENKERKIYEEALQKYSEELTDTNWRLTASVSRRMRAEAELKKGEERIRAVVEQMTDGLVTVDRDGYVESFNSAAQRIFGYSADEIIGRKADLLISPKGESGNGNVLDTRLWIDGEGTLANNEKIMGQRKDGTEFPMDLSVSEVHLEDQSLIVTTVRDVTDSRRLEEQTRESLAEKEVLLKEIHHRVKNNLQLISSLLALQAGYIQDEDSKAIFKDSEQRVRSMALIHEKLYGSDDLARVDFPGYLPSLVTELSRSYVPNPMAVAMNVDVGDISFGIDTAIPCGLIVSELVSNALKYAFPDGRTGEIKVSLFTDQEKYILTVSDDGVGIPNEVDWENSDSLGLQLIQTLTAQLGGSAELITDHGTEIRIIFPNSDE